MFQFIPHTDVVFPNETVELRGFDIHDHGRALKVLDEVAVIDMGQSLHEHLIEMLAKLCFATFVQEQKILDLLGVGRLVREVLLHHHHGRKEQNGHAQERVTIPPKELHGVVFNRGCGLLQRTISRHPGSASRMARMTLAEGRKRGLHWLTPRLTVGSNVWKPGDPSVFWWSDLPNKPVHGAVRNQLFFDWHVQAVQL